MSEPSHGETAEKVCLALAFAGGSELHTDDRLFLAAAPAPGGVVTFATLAAHAENDPCTYSETTIVNVHHEETSELSQLQPSCNKLSISPVLLRCNLNSSRLKQSAAVERFANMFPGLHHVWGQGQLKSSNDLLQGIQALAPQPSSDMLGLVCQGRFSTGPKVWPAAVELCNRISGSDLASVVSRATAIELGCGLGLPSAVALLAGAKSALLTDSGCDVEAAVQGVLQTVFSSWHREGRLRFMSFEWGAPQTRELLKSMAASGLPRPDLILCCDCVYEPFFGDSSWQLLADTIAVLLKEQEIDSPGSRVTPVALLSVEHRIEGIDGVDSFLAALAAHGLSVKSLAPTSEQKSNPDTEIEVIIVTSKAGDLLPSCSDTSECRSEHQQLCP
mmetsp:Transcript_110671/g.219980  ORF Transcript_110671/g.219980 Transcript_110671/m.219980 type:complete len:389 (-) Transcript_110671:33-1199(-)